jgi:hypothetical protein
VAGTGLYFGNLAYVRAGDEAAAAATAAQQAGTVTLSAAAAASPKAAQVRELFTQYFDSINTLNYAEYKSTQASGTPQTHLSFEQDFESTKDSNEVINSITDKRDGTLTVRVSFTSTQDPSDSIDGRPCNDWTLNLPLVRQGSGYVMGLETSYNVTNC